MTGGRDGLEEVSVMAIDEWIAAQSAREEGDDAQPRPPDVPDDAKVFWKPRPGHLPWVVERRVELRYAYEEEARKAAREVGEPVFMRAGDFALVGEVGPDGEASYHVSKAETPDRRYFPDVPDHEPGQVGSSYYDDDLVGALADFLDAVNAVPLPPEWLATHRRANVPGLGRRDVVVRWGRRVVREEWSSSCPDGRGVCFTGEAEVAVCATDEELQARFDACVAELWRTADGGEPDPAIVGVVKSPSGD
jgi:hypothetical protein